MIEITPTLSIQESEIQLEFVKATGPGGQNVNKVATAVQLRFDVKNSPVLDEAVRQRLYRIARKRISEEGMLIIEAKRFRSQEQNREDALQRLVHLIQEAVKEPKVRRKTRPSPAAKEERLRAKKQRGKIKQWRSKKVGDL
jgi:ribosome-associated protein